jgi:NADH-quinone oxidoreductase subunit M
VLAGGGLVIAMIYALRMIQLSFHGSPREKWVFPDLSVLETGVLYVMIALLIVLGLFPQPILRAVDQVVAGVMATVGGGA